jgi:hypothetical protein
MISIGIDRLAKENGKCVCVYMHLKDITDMHMVILFISVPPNLDGPIEEMQEVVKGEPILLQCPITGSPNPQIRWTKDGFDLNFK